MAAVIQVLVRARTAGALFTRDPLTGEDTRLVEASWGLGRAVMDGMVTPDSYRIARGGCIIERRAGEKDLEIRCRDADEGVVEQQVESERAAELCLCDDQLFALESLASRCEAAFPGSHDLEFAFDGSALHLLQRRAISGFPPG
jgi:pyruvate,water dikinase